MPSSGKNCKKLNTTFRECIGAGRANEALRYDWQQAEILKLHSSWEPVAVETVRVDKKGLVRKIIGINENDVCMLTWSKL
jgi:hypothetical protein